MVELATALGVISGFCLLCCVTACVCGSRTSAPTPPPVLPRAPKTAGSRPTREETPRISTPLDDVSVDDVLWVAEEIDDLNESELWGGKPQGRSSMSEQWRMHQTRPRVSVPLPPPVAVPQSHTHIIQPISGRRTSTQKHQSHSHRPSQLVNTRSAWK